MNTVYSNLPVAPQAIVATNDVVGPIEVTGVERLSMACAIGLFAAGTFAASSLAANAVTITAHGYQTGTLGQMTTAGTLPTGLALTTNYYIIVLDLNTVSFASSRANAIAGTAIAISGGVGNSTFTPSSVTGGTVQAQWSNDQVKWHNLGSPTTVAAAMDFSITYQKPEFRYFQFVFAITGGSLSTTTTAFTTTVKGG
jgi:hypothetical protein